MKKIEIKGKISHLKPTIVDLSHLKMGTIKGGKRSIVIDDDVIMRSGIVIEDDVVM